jgi:hypothetical protein
MQVGGMCLDGDVPVAGIGGHARWVLRGQFSDVFTVSELRFLTAAQQAAPASTISEVDWA